MNNNKITGGCFCGAVLYQVNGALRDVVTCHCSQCTRLLGSNGPHSKVLKKNLVLTNDEGLKWFEISKISRRGFCKHCGSGLFWDAIHQDSMGIVAGSINTPTGLKTIGHIFVADKPDFYDINDGLPQFQTSSEGELEGDYL